MRVQSVSGADVARFNRSATPAVSRSTDVSTAWPSPNLWSIFGGVASNTGIPVTPLTVLQSATVQACVRCIAEDFSKMPLSIQRRRDDGSWGDDRDHPLNHVLGCPNSWQTPFQFWSFMLAQKLLRGNALAVLIRGWNGGVVGMIPVNWDHASVYLSATGRLIYTVSHPAIGYGLRLDQEDVLHLRNALSLDGGYLGMSTVASAADVFGLALAAQTHGATMFRQGAQVAGTLETDAVLSPEGAARIREDFAKFYAGLQNVGKTVVLEQGLKFQRMALTAEESQFLEARKFSREEICAMFRVPPHKVQDLEHAHFDNLELSERSYVNDALQPQAVEVTQRLSKAMLFDDERRDFRFLVNFDALFVGDFKARMEGYTVAVNNGLMLANEARSREGWSAVAGGDVMRAPLNLAPLTLALQASQIPGKSTLIGHDGGPALDDGGDGPKPAADTATA